MASAPSSARSSTRGARAVALDILCRVENGAYASALLEADRGSRLAGGPEAALVQELVRGVLTWRNALDNTLAAYLSQPLGILSPELCNLLRLGVYQLRYLDRVPGYAIVSEAVSAARKHGTRGQAQMVNAVLRGVSERRRPEPLPRRSTDLEGYLCVAESHPRWLVRRWLKRLGPEETSALCRANNTRPELTIRVNSLRVTRDALLRRLGESGIHAEESDLAEGYLRIPRPRGLFQTEAHLEGLFSVQGVGAGLAVRLLDPKPGERVLDVCSAPGGKATAASERMANRGLVAAVDLRLGRLRRLRQNLRRLGTDCVRPVAGDATRLPTAQAFDRILVDAPCSALGILARQPDLRWHRSESDLAGLPELQLRLLLAASEGLRPNGVLVYSTCTLEPEENEEVVASFLATRSGLRLQPASEVLGPAWGGRFLRVLPHEHGCDGAFGARFVRTGF